MERAQKRLDVIWAFYEEDKNAKKMERSGRIEEFVESIGERLETIKAAMQEKPSAYLDNVKEEISEIRVKYGIYLEKITQLKYFKDIRKRAIIKGNPGMVSRKFKEVLEELKDAVIFPEDYFNPRNSVTGELKKTANTYSIHWYSASWMPWYQRLKATIGKPIHRIIAVIKAQNGTKRRN